jgi:putative DNA primase/helicase
MSVLSAGRRKPPVMPSEIFGPAWGMLNDMAQGAGAPVDYLGISYLAVTASLIGAKRRVQPYRESDWCEPCILWAGMVGDPSSNKSPALDRTTNALRDMEKEHALDHAERIRDWKADSERAKVEWGTFQGLVKEAAKEGLPTPSMPDNAADPDKPQRRRLMVQDSTPEMLAEILSGNPSGTLHVRDELAGWIASFDRYSPGGQQFWLECYGGRPFVVDRKGNVAPVTVPFTGVSVIGGIQPEKLAEALLTKGKPDDGLPARLLWAWPDRPPFKRPQRCGDQRQLSSIYDRLNGLAWATGPDGEQCPMTMPLEEKASDIFAQFQEENGDAGEDVGGLFKSFCGKLPGMVLRLALVSELTRWAFEGGAEPTSISARTIAAVAEFVDEYAKPSALRVYGDAALPPVERNAATLARYIKRHRLSAINARDLKRTVKLPGMREAEPLNEAIALLVEAHWLRPDGARAGATAGRKSADYTVNPLVKGVEHGQVA